MDQIQSGLVLAAVIGAQGSRDIAWALSFEAHSLVSSLGPVGLRSQADSSASYTEKVTPDRTILAAFCTSFPCIEALSSQLSRSPQLDFSLSPHKQEIFCPEFGRGSNTLAVFRNRILDMGNIGMATALCLYMAGIHPLELLNQPTGGSVVH
ncbi:hypothetical protein TWF106_003927 [Orbilia oligospora]|uniref:Uncharacterized protein n=1 Tax=Orbilia oligospora TaxID=2813651 RepID=A0A7C8V6E6_ORBOL|nr:hypothetical protein TWF679_002323 [Orbilia oligospora]KAF3224462.1 hypothetical protein TWF106_003927 [Orbilia oligospora]